MTGANDNPTGGRLGELRARVYTDREALAETLKRDHADKTIVFTNGCFDLPHVGHVVYLNQARALGDLLVLGLNADGSVRNLKGEGRPVNAELDRALVLAALECIDFVVIFPEDTPIETLRIIQPDIHTKGGDYKVDDLPEKETVLAGGGRIEILPFQTGYSTTGILDKAKDS